MTAIFDFLIRGPSNMSIQSTHNHKYAIWHFPKYQVRWSQHMDIA